MNGSGKTTLFNILAGKLTPDSGSVVWNHQVSLGYFTQETGDFCLEISPYDFLLEKFGSRYSDQELKNFLSGFRLKFYSSIARLSGGEKSKLKLLSLLLDDINFLLLDEPTNHMDIYSIDGLKEIIGDFRGTIFLSPTIVIFLKPSTQKRFFWRATGYGGC